MLQPQVSVIIPVYKAERYIERCVRTLFAQTLDSIEYIFIDDCSPDKSMDVMEKVLSEYPCRKGQVKVIRHSVNQGVGRSRQDGMDVAYGEYVIHCDPDDWVELDMYEKLYLRAKEHHADLVIGAYVEETFSGSNIVLPMRYSSKKEMFSQIVRSKFHAGLWNKLVKREQISLVRIPEGVNLWEDMAVMVPILMSADRIEYAVDAIYHYRVENWDSITHQPSDKSAYSQIEAVKSIISFLNTYSEIVDVDNNDVLYLKWRAKRGLLNNCTKENCIMWKNTFKDVSESYYKLDIPLKSKILSFLGYYKCYWLIRFLSYVSY